MGRLALGLCVCILDALDLESRRAFSHKSKRAVRRGREHEGARTFCELALVKTKKVYGKVKTGLKLLKPVRLYFLDARSRYFIELLVLLLILGFSREPYPPPLVHYYESSIVCSYTAFKALKFYGTHEFAVSPYGIYLPMSSTLNISADPGFKLTVVPTYHLRFPESSVRVRPPPHAPRPEVSAGRS